jgi:hypothetical protein
MPKDVMLKWWRIDFQVAGQSGFTGGTASTCSIIQPVPLDVVDISGSPFGISVSAQSATATSRVRNAHTTGV